MIKGNQAGTELAILGLCIAIQAQAKSLAPVDTGNLRASIGYLTPLQNEGNLSGVRPEWNEGYVGTNVEYGIWQEYGTYKMPPQPFLRPAGLIYATGKSAQEVMKAFNDGMATELPKD